MKFLNNIDLRQNEIQNFRVQNLATAPASPVVGQHYYNTADNTEYVWNGTKWIDALSQGDYTFSNGIQESGRNVSLKLVNETDVTLTANSDGLAAEVNLTGYAKASEAAAIEATDSLKTALGKLEAKADEKVVANSAITAGTKTKITYDAKGLVTAGADLSQADIPELNLAKITDVTATAAEVNVLDGITASTEELNILDGVTASTAEINILDGVTADKDEINILDGATISTDELNYLDGVTSAVQTQLNAKVEKNDDITAGTKCKITYDAKGLVTGGANLSESDIPTLDSAKIGSMASYEKASAKAAIATDDTLNQAIGKLEYKIDKALVANEDITAGTHTKITYDAKGLVTAGADLSEADIPEIHLAKVSDVTATAAEVNILDGATLTTTELNYVDGVTSSIQDQLDDKVAKNDAITAGTATKITYDAKGLVTAGADLSEADIPAIHLAKVTDVTATASEVNQLHEAGAVKADFEKLHDITVSAADLNKINDKLELDSLSAVGPITYDNTSGEISATYDNAPTDDSTNLVKSGVIKAALDDKLDTSLKGAANGLAELDANGLVPAAQLPSYVDDVLELLSITTAPSEAAAGDLYYDSTAKKIYTYKNGSWGDAADPETGKIYVCNDMSYRWSGTAMVQIGADKLKGFNGSIVGDGTTTNFTINHNLGTRNVVFEIYEASSPYEKVYVQVLHTSTTALNVVFGTAPAVGEDYTVTVIAIG